MTDRWLDCLSEWRFVRADTIYIYPESRPLSCHSLYHPAFLSCCVETFVVIAIILELRLHRNFLDQLRGDRSSPHHDFA